MSIFFIVNVIIENKNNRILYDEYIKKVKPIVEGFGGKYITRSEEISIFAGTWIPDRVIIIEFESREQFDKCFSSEEYRNVQGLRENSVVTNAYIVEK